ncbi:acetyl-CoA C-acetyltransferase [uncultured Limosilactobacillus sp.]|uniref:acetyl-CoA C-acetyltransferase n=1 Tax=uncultured Limosilactobacillus sp. TaxID=2837629 RepID=UPI0025D6BA03|nr:acetyl-CoA C-acetyltransferase [uncultured Limosilactobacillus sp.]
MEKVVFVSAKRTPIGKLGGALASQSAVDLGSLVIGNVLADVSINIHDVNEVFMGNVLAAGQGQNPARQAALAAGLPEQIPATTINDVCGSGMQAIRLAAQQILLGVANVVIAGGMESMSNAPYLIPKGRFGYRYGNAELVDSLYQDGLKDAYGNYPMGMTAENLLAKYPESRQTIDQLALASQQKAATAQQAGRFADEIVPVTVNGRHGQTRIVKDDEAIRHTSMDQLAKLKPVFKEDGQVTAGNSSGINDGAAAVLLTSERYAKDHGLPILGYWSASSLVGVDPAIMGIGPYYAIQKLLQTTNHTQDEIDLFEINEAFANQALTVIHKLGIDPQVVNVNGGAIALGHPLGATGARIIVTLLHEMQRRNVHSGVASLCIGGGMGAATLINH